MFNKKYCIIIKVLFRMYNEFDFKDMKSAFIISFKIIVNIFNIYLLY